MPPVTYPLPYSFETGSLPEARALSSAQPYPTLLQQRGHTGLSDVGAGTLNSGLHARAASVHLHYSLGRLPDCFSIVCGDGLLGFSFLAVLGIEPRASCVLHH